MGSSKSSVAVSGTIPGGMVHVDLVALRAECLARALAKDAVEGPQTEVRWYTGEVKQVPFRVGRF